MLANTKVPFHSSIPLMGPSMSFHSLRSVMLVAWNLLMMLFP